jgi:hypothetical protein
MVGDFISESWAISNRNGGRFHFGIMGDFERNQHADTRVAKKAARAAADSFGLGGTAKRGKRKKLVDFMVSPRSSRFGSLGRTSMVFLRA